MIDKKSSIPLYYQLKEIIRGEISLGIYNEDGLPPEWMLCEKYSVSRSTVRQAINDLVNEGSLQTIRGKGTFIAPPKIEEDLLSLYGFSKEMQEKGHETFAKIISLRKVPVCGRLKAAFFLNGFNEMYSIIRLRYVDKEPLFIERTNIPCSIIADIPSDQLSEEHVYSKLLMNKGIMIKGAKKSIEPIIIDEYESSLLGIAMGSPGLLLERLSLDQEDRGVIFTRWIIRGDRCRHYLLIK